MKVKFQEKTGIQKFKENQHYKMLKKKKINK